MDVIFSYVVYCTTKVTRSFRTRMDVRHYYAFATGQRRRKYYVLGYPVCPSVHPVRYNK